ncbi:MAG: zinc metallopeptidase [Desulfobacterales bacterium]|nr:zinc metallopeptidase [Desulfobacterales bacterium]
MKKRIGVAPIGEVPKITLKSIAAHILGYLNLDVDILPPLEYPAYAYDEKRLQYDVGHILKALASQHFNDYAKIVGILDLDIFVPIFSYVFGEARQGGRHALVSIYRLKINEDASIPPMALLLERAGKVALHELGHLYNLRHCMDRECLMHFSGELDDLDKTPLNFCRYCAVYFRDALQKSTVVD